MELLLTRHAQPVSTNSMIAAARTLIMDVLLTRHAQAVSTNSMIAGDR